MWRNGIVLEKDKQALFIGGSSVSFENVSLCGTCFARVLSFMLSVSFGGGVCIFIFVTRTQVLNMFIMVP